MLRIVSPGPRKHAESIFDLVARCFPGPGVERQREFLRKGRIGHSHYDWATSRIGFVGDVLATHVGVYDFQMRIAGARVRVGGVGMVATHPNHRRRGLCAHTIASALDAMDSAGYDLSFLSSHLEGYYGRFGYVQAWPAHNCRVSALHLPQAPLCPRSRPFAVRHRDDLAAIYNARNASLTGTAVRPTFRRSKMPGAYQGVLWLDALSEPAGYVVYERREDTLAVLDQAGEPEPVLRAAAWLARRLKCAEVEFIFLHPRSDLARHLRHGNCRIETLYRRQSAAMIRTVSLRRTLAKLCPELSLRLQGSRLAGWCGSLAIEDGRERITLAIEPSEVRVVHSAATHHEISGGDEITQLLIGADEPLDVAQQTGIRLSGDAERLLPVLLPALEPQLSLVDQP